MLPNELFLGIHMYGVMIAVGLLCAFLVLFYYSKKKNIDSKLVDFVFYDGVVSIAFGFFSAALFQALYNYIKNPVGGFHFGSGITFIGGLIGGVICFLAVYFIFKKRLNIRLLDIIDIIPCSIFVAHGWGRIGCFFAGCCYGKETSSFLGVQFPNLPNPVYPTQLFEAAFLFIMFGICSYLVLKKDFKHNLGLYLISYGIFRFLIEFLRGDDRGQIFGGLISPSQFWSIIMIIAGVATIFLFERLRQNYSLEPQKALASEGKKTIKAQTNSEEEKNESPVEQEKKTIENKGSKDTTNTTDTTNTIDTTNSKDNK